MSLVVAEITERGARIVSDTRVSFLDGRRPKIKTGTLKAVVVSPKFAICFSGDVEKGLKSVRHFSNALSIGTPLDQMISELKSISAETQRSVEFIVANAHPDSRLIRIRENEVEKNLKTAWIGEREGFERFQQERLKPLDDFEKQMMSSLPNWVQDASRFDKAMDTVINDTSIQAVDDFCVRIASKNAEFNYLGGTFIHLGRDIRIENNDNLILKMAQSVEEGGYAVTIVEPEFPGTPALALNFPRAKMGYIYLPLRYDEAQVVENVLARDFSEKIREVYSVSMQQPMLR